VELQPKTANDEETFSAKPKSLPLSVTLPAGICEQTLASAKRSTSSVQRQVSPQVLAQPARQATPAQREPAQTRQLSAASAAAEPAPAAMFSVEAEQLAQAGKILVNGGRVDVQDMAAFGSGWSGNAQLFWTGGAVGGVLDLLVDVPVAATYTLEIYLTRAPDYADLSIEVDGTPSPVEFSAFAAGVMAPGPTQAGKFSLQPGPRKVSLMITGKYPQSTGYFVGIDRVVLYPAGAP
jgi:hypothetical protein